MVDVDLLKEVKSAVEKWMDNEGANAESQSSVDDRRIALFNALKALIPKNHDSVEPTTKKQKLSDGETEPRDVQENVQKPNSRTMMDVAFLILDKCKDEQLGTLAILFQNDGDKKIVAMEAGGDTRDGFKSKIHEKVAQQCQIYRIEFGRQYFRPDQILDQAYVDLEILFCPDGKSSVEKALQATFESNQTQDKDEVKWEEDFVISEGNKQPDINFSMDMSKGQAVVIAGESGSGKSWFAKKWLPSKYPNASFIYYELGDDDAKKFGHHTPEHEKLGLAYKMAMQILFENGMTDDTPVYQAVSELSRQNNCVRNEASVELFQALVQKAINRSQVARDWWTDPKHTLEELVIIIDEMGKAPDFGRGIVDEVRQIYMNIRNRKLANKVMIVLVGAGLDHFIGKDTIDFDEGGADGVCEKEFYTSFGTDPMKSSVTVLKGPNLDRNKISGIPIKDIMNGTYSQVLATNTRMLTRGVIPVLKSEMNTLRVDDPSLRRVELGSTNIVMDYAARVYIELNGLSRLHKKEQKKFEALLLCQFRLLAQKSRAKCCRNQKIRNPAFEPTFQISNKEHEGVLRAGLITADIVGTSKALRYLACKGQTAPLYAQDGIGFEIVLQHHLVRLCRAEYKGGDKEYYCGKYALSQAWPPSATTKKGLDTLQKVQEEVKSRYGNENENGSLVKDINQIATLVKGKRDFDLVLRQTVSNLQGADVLVLSKRGDKAIVNLDLYQAKHYAKLPSRGSKNIIGAFASIGVFYDPKQNLLETEPKTGSAAYSYMGTQRFAMELSIAIGIEVAIRKRIVVFSQGWDSFLDSETWKQFDFTTAAKDKKVFVWTREMLEPTISALVTGPAFTPRM